MVTYTFPIIYDSSNAIPLKMLTEMLSCGDIPAIMSQVYIMQHYPVGLKLLKYDIQLL